MKVVYSFLVLGLFVVGSFSEAYSAPGDTTWVQANDVQLNYYDDFDQAVEFPDDTKTYRKILMYFVLGKYTCPSSEQYCHQWDYTVQNYVMTESDTVEISRLITPYATQGWARFNGNWKQPYIFDITNFEPLLHGEATHRIHYSGYSGGFTADVKFAFIEGTPDRDVIGFETLYTGSFQHGNASNPINSNFPLTTLTTPENTKAADLKVLITGHGSDNNQCCEFMSHNYRLQLNGSQIANQPIWKDDCGLNHLYPQGGTWIYDRANWCPGEKVFPIYHPLEGINTGNTDFDLQMKFGNYIGGGNLGSYTTTATVFYYGDLNKALDASIETIVSPTNDVNYYRNNPSGGNPEIVVKNTGSTAITSIEFSYGVAGYPTQSYTWTGNIASLEERHIDLEALAALEEMSAEGLNGVYSFKVKIVSVNGTTDEDATNNMMKSDFVVAPNYPAYMIVDFKTSNIGANGALNGNPADGSWKITDASGNMVFERTNNSPATEYTDTIAFTEAGFYKLTITTSDCGGLNWWAYSGGLSGYKSGHFKLKNGTGTLIPMKDYKYAGQQRDDFGCEFTQYFSISEEGLGINDFEMEGAKIKVYPNPATAVLNVELENISGEGTVSLINMMGQVVYDRKVKESQLTIPTENLSAGIYTFLYSNAGRQYSDKIIIAE